MFPTLRVSKHQRSRSKSLVSIPCRDVVWLAVLALASMESCRVDWCSGDGKVRDVPEEVEVPSVDAP